MTLTTHAVVGTTAMAAAVATLGSTPMGLVVGFAVGFASHFAIDAIPHWEEGRLLRSVVGNESDPLSYDMRLGKDFFIDLAIIGSDALLGLLVSVLIFHFWLFHLSPLIIVLGVVAGQLPDALQFLFYKLRPHFMAPLQRFHVEMQTELRNPLALLIEVALTVALVGSIKFFI